MKTCPICKLTLDCCDCEKPSASVSGSGADLIAEERRRQIEVEKWSPSLDDGYDLQLVKAAKCYLEPAEDRFLSEVKNVRGEKVPFGWPWHPDWWKPTNPIRDRVKAGALIAAHIDKLQREMQRECDDKQAAWEAEGQGS
jgi:hypothetical protein